MQYYQYSISIACVHNVLAENTTQHCTIKISECSITQLVTVQQTCHLFTLCPTYWIFTGTQLMTHIRVCDQHNNIRIVERHQFTSQRPTTLQTWEQQVSMPVCNTGCCGVGWVVGSSIMQCNSPNSLPTYLVFLEFPNYNSWQAVVLLLKLL